MYRVAALLLLTALVLLPTDALARETPSSDDQGLGSRLTLATIKSSAATSAAGDPVPRIQCPAGYTARIHVEGLSAPDGLAFSPAGVLYVAEELAGRVSRVEPYGSVAPVLSGLSSPEGIAFDDAGNLYVVEDVAGGRLAKMTMGGVTATLAADLDAPEGVVWASDGTLYITESNVQFASPEDFRTHVTAVSPLGDVTRILTDTLWWSYAGITIGPGDALYVTNEASGLGTNHSIFTVDPATGTRTLFASKLTATEGLRFGPNGGFPLYVVEEDVGGGVGRLSRVEVDGAHTPFCTGFDITEDVALDDGGRLYVSEDGSGSIIRIDPGPPDRAHPHAAILFIGDGMGEAHRIAARWSAVGQNGTLAMDTMPFGGWARTAAADDPVTDSAAAATAIATGVKTNIGMIGQDPAGNPLTTILELAQARGMAVGLVTNTPMAHATPAAFAAHVPTRTMMTEIARQMLAAEVDVLLGGGEDEFLPSTATGCYTQPGKRSDGRNLIAEAVAAGYTYVCDATAFAAVVPTATTRLLGLFADEEMPRPFSPSLAEMTHKAIAILSQDPDGFFLMVEGGQIDRAAHQNEAADVISDTVGLDEAIAVAQAYASIAGDTLIVVTADHETGGMSADLTSSGGPDEDGPFYMPGGTPFYVNWTTGEHTAADVPTTAQGPWSDLLTGTYENTHIHDVMHTALESLPVLTLTQVVVPPPGSAVSPGDHITYTLTFTNNGTADATGLALTDTLPAGVRYVPGSASATPGLRIAATPPPALVFTGMLPASGALTATFGVTVSTVSSGTPLVNRAEVKAQDTGPVTATTTHTVVVDPPHLLIAKTATPISGSPVEPGDWITYTVSVVNDGGPTSGVVISDTLDLAHVTPVISHTTGGQLSGPNPLWVTGLDLDPGQGVILTLGVTVTGDVSGTVITNRASLTGTQTPLPQASNVVTHVVSSGSTPLPGFTLTKSADPPGGTPLTRGDTITYTLVAYNGGGPATNVVLTDAIPAGTAYLLDSVTTAPGDADFDGTRVTVSLPSFPTGLILTTTFRVMVTIDITTTITNTALLISAQGESRESNAVSHLVQGTKKLYCIYLPTLLKGFIGSLTTDH